MPLRDIELSLPRSSLPQPVAAFLREADLRISQYLLDEPAAAGGFVPSDYPTIYRALAAIAEGGLSAGRSFCEWGSGFGVVAALAAILEFDACGIEANPRLVDLSRELAEDFEIPVQFVHGSFIPDEDDADFDAYDVDFVERDDLTWLVTDLEPGYRTLGRTPHDLDLVFAYPWPDEEWVVAELFERHAARGALLLTPDLHRAVRLRRKVRR